MIDSKVRLTGSGYTVTLADSAEKLLRQLGGGGWGMAPVVNSWFEGAGDGAQLRGVRRAQRELRIPVAAFGENPRAIEDNIRELVRVIRAPFVVHIDFANGESFWIEATYDSGLEGVYTTAPDQWAQFTVVLKCPDPYWTSDAEQAFVIAPTPADEPFLNELAGLHVASAAAFGSVAVNNVGDVESRPTWTVHGPGTGLVIQVNGVGLELDYELDATDVVTIRYYDGGWTIENLAGDNLYPYLVRNPAPVFPVLPPGGAIVTASMDDTGVDSFIRAVYPERREVVY